MTSAPVALHVYDLSQGMARQISPMLLGKQFDGIWHTGIVVFSTEYYFGGGICADPPASTPYGTPVRTIQLGSTTKTKQQFLDFLASVANRFSIQTYNIINNNCNNFSDACARFLLGEHTGIPDYIVDLPREVFATQLGAALRPLVENMQNSIRDQSLGHQVQLVHHNTPPSPTHSSSSAGLSYTTSNGDVQPRASQQPNDSPAETSLATRVKAISESPVLLLRAQPREIVAKLREFYPAYDGDAHGTELRPSTLLAATANLPPGQAFPALDLLRLAAARSADNCAEVAAAIPGLVRTFAIGGTAKAEADRMMCLRAAVNCFAFGTGAISFLKANVIGTLLDAVTDSLAVKSTKVTKTAAILAFNLCGAAKRYAAQVPALSDDFLAKMLYSACERANTSGVPALPEESFYLLATIGILVEYDDDFLDFVRSLDFALQPYLDPVTCQTARTREMAMLLQRALQST